MGASKAALCPRMVNEKPVKSAIGKSRRSMLINNRFLRLRKRPTVLHLWAIAVRLMLADCGGGHRHIARCRAELPGIGSTE